MRFSNTEGPANCRDHYGLPPLSRLDIEGVLALISQSVLACETTWEIRAGRDRSQPVTP